MSRGLWFVAGAGAGVYAVVRGRRAAEALTVDGLSDRINGLLAGARVFREEVAQGAAEKETELRERLALPPQPDRTPPQLTTHPTGGNGTDPESDPDPDTEAGTT